MAKRIVKRESKAPAAGKASRRRRQPEQPVEVHAIKEDRWKGHPFAPIPLTQAVYDSFMSWCPPHLRPPLNSEHQHPPLKAKLGLKLVPSQAVSDLCRETGQKGVMVLEKMCVQLGPHSFDQFLLCAFLTHLGKSTPKPHVFRKLLNSSTSPRCVLDPQGSPDVWGISEQRVVAALESHHQLTMKAWQDGSHETSQLYFYSYHVAASHKLDKLERLRQNLRLTGSAEERQEIRDRIAALESDLRALTQRNRDRMSATPTATRWRLCEVNWCVGELP